MSRNPYTGKTLKTALDYSGPRTAKGVVDFVTNKLPSKVIKVTDDTLASFTGTGALPKVRNRSGLETRNGWDWDWVWYLRLIQ